MFTQLNNQTGLFRIIQFSISHFFCTQFKCQTVLFDPLIGSYQVLPPWVRVSQRSMTVKEHSAFPKAPVSLPSVDRLYVAALLLLHYSAANYVEQTVLFRISFV